MSTIELKNILIRRIGEINDKLFLEAIATILETKLEDKIYRLTPEQNETILESKKQVAKGEVFSNDQVKREVDKWL